MQEGQGDFLDLMEPETGVEPAAPVATDKAPSPALEAKADDRPRNPDGTFAEKPKDEQVTKGDKPEASQPPAPAPPAEPEGDHVPIAALKAERAKRQALEAELAKIKPAASAQSPPTPKGPEFTSPKVDFENDPNGSLAAIPDMLLNQKMQVSTFWAHKEHSEAQVAEAWDAFCKAAESDPETSALSWKLRDHLHPMGEVMRWYARQKDMQRLQEAGGLDKLIEQRLAAIQAQQPVQMNGAAQTAPRTPAPPTPPPSLANGGAGSNDAPEMPTEDEVFNGLFEEARKPRKR